MGTAASSIFCSPSSRTSVTALTTAAADKPPKPKDSKRLFVAVELPDDAKQLCLETITEKLLPLDKTRNEQQNDVTSVNWVLDPSLFHCTLQFLGSVDGEHIEDLSNQLRKQVQSTAPFSLQLGGLGCFPKHKSTQNASVIWLGLDGSTQELKDLASNVMDGTEPLGFCRERRPFSAHVTLGRVKRKSNGNGRQRTRGRGDLPTKSSSFPAALQDQLEKMMNSEEKEPATERTCSFHVNHVALMESKFSEGRPQYITLERFNLHKSD